MVCDPEAVTRRVVVFAARPVPFAGYGRLEAEGTPDELGDVVASLVAADPPPPASQVTDVLVCTHGSRDTCCGSLGTRLWLDAAPGLGAVRVWRTSHTGGHRFAPTAVTFPDGNYWASLDGRVLAGIVARSIPAGEAAAHLRGCAWFAPAVQVADRAALAARGWEWLECLRSGEERGALQVELGFEAPDGSRGSYDVRLVEGRRIPLPDCGADPACAAKSQIELGVAQFCRSS